MVLQSRSATLTERAYQHIRRKLVSGELAPGTRLVNRALAKEIGASAIPVREAISRLISEGMVEYVPSAGAFVRERTPQELADMYDLREAIEPMAAAKAAEHISDHELEELQSIVDDWREMVRGLRHRPEGRLSPAQADRWHDNDERFHRLVVDAAHNGLLSKFHRELRVVAQVFDAYRRRGEVIAPAAAESMCRAHEALLQGLRSRDPERMHAAMLTHVRKSREQNGKRRP